MFSIRFHEECIHSEQAAGLIVLDDFREEFLSSLSTHGRKQYTTFWRVAARDVLKEGDYGVFPTSINCDNVEIWIGKNQVDNVIFHQHILKISSVNITEKYVDLLDKDPLLRIDDDWSTWIVPVNNIREYLALW